MSSDLFLTCFVACTFSFMVFSVVAYQLTFFFARRWFTKNGVKFLQSILGGDPATMDPFTAGVNLTGGDALRDFAGDLAAQVICPSCNASHVITFAELRDLPRDHFHPGPLLVTCSACRQKSAA